MSVDFQIVGCGVFGLSLALELKQRLPGATLRLFDRYEPPVTDGASVDTSRIIRADYADPVYAALGIEARAAWLADTQLQACYHETGFILTVQGDDDRGYLDSCLANVKASGVAATELSHTDIFARIKQDGSHAQNQLRGYANPISGWADAEATIRVLYARLKAQSGVSFVFDQVTHLLYKGDAVSGLETVSREQYHAKQTVLATGAWQLPDVAVPTLATGQVIAWIALSEEEEQRLSDTFPVLINFSSGWFVIPASKGELKIARHALGYTAMETIGEGSLARHISVPRTSLTHPGQRIPEEGEQALRQGLELFLPDFATRPFKRTRTCWYSDTPKGDFLIDWHPSIRNLFIATGGSGHAFKFAPILGREIAKILLPSQYHDPEMAAVTALRRQKWSFAAAHEALETGKGDGSRGVGSYLEWDDIA